MQESVTGIIVNYKTMQATEKAVRSLLGEPEIADVVVVDNCSADGSVEYLKQEFPEERVRVVANDRNAGFGEGVNIGARSSSGAMLFMLNSDAVIERGGLGPLVELLLAEPRVALAAPTISRPDGSAQTDTYGEFPRLRTMLLRTNRHPPDQIRPDWVSGAAMLLRRSAFDAVGGFDPSFHMYLEDVDLCRRLRGAGWDILRVPESHVVHEVGTSSTSEERTGLYRDSLSLLLRKSGSTELQIRLVRMAHRVWSAVRSRIPGSDH